MAGRRFAAVPPGGSLIFSSGSDAPRLAKGGDGGDNGDMENRLRSVENSIVRIDTVLPTLVTKDDLNKAVGDVHSDLNKAVGDVRSDLNKAVGDLRSELHKAVGDVRSELHKAVGDVRSELHKAVGDVRSELHKAINEQTWKFVTFVTSVCIALTAAVYFIARNVH